MAALKTQMSEVIGPAIAGLHGRVVKTMGDGFIAEFRSVVDAVRSAAAIQRRLAERNAEAAPDKRLELRIGLNLGDVVVEGCDLMGDGVNIAARLEGLAEPAGVWISGAAYDQLQGKLDIPLEFCGEQRLKNIARPVRAYRIRLDKKPATSRFLSHRTYSRTLWPGAAALVLALATVAWLFVSHRTAPGLVGRASLAVLPFANIAGDEATGRLADGLTEDIITDLSRYRTMDVIAHNSTERYKGKAVDVREVGKSLNVRYALEGSVQREGDQIRVTAQLIDAISDTHLWSERWDRPSKEFFALQSDIASQLGNRLGEAGVIDKAEQEAARRSRPDNFSAYELYLQGRTEALQMSAEGNKKAIELFERAVAADSRLARAWADLAYTRENSIQHGADSAVVTPRALAEARRAVEIDPSDAGAHATLAYILGMQGNFGPSEAEFDTALRLNPGDADILAEYSGWASGFGREERGAEAADRAIRAQSQLSDMAGLSVLLGIFQRRPIRKCFAHPGAAPQR